MRVLQKIRVVVVGVIDWSGSSVRHGPTHRRIIICLVGAGVDTGKIAIADEPITKHSLSAINGIARHVANAVALLFYWQGLLLVHYISCWTAGSAKQWRRMFLVSLILVYNIKSGCGRRMRG